VRTVWLLFAAIFVTIYFALAVFPSAVGRCGRGACPGGPAHGRDGRPDHRQTNGIRYIEKPPLPTGWWPACTRIFGQNTFATHLPNALAMLGSRGLAWAVGRGGHGAIAQASTPGWACSLPWAAFSLRASSFRAILAFFLLLALYALIASLEDGRPALIYWAYAGVALALLTRPDCAGILSGARPIPYLLLTRQWRRWKALKPVTGLLVFLAIAAPWHIACGIINHDQGNLWATIPQSETSTVSSTNTSSTSMCCASSTSVTRTTTNKMPDSGIGLAHLVWIFPWSLFLPAAVAVAWKTRRSWLKHLRHGCGGTRWTLPGSRHARRRGHVCSASQVPHAHHLAAEPVHGVDMLFFSILDQQEYYTFPCGRRLSC